MIQAVRRPGASVSLFLGLVTSVYVTAWFVIGRLSTLGSASAVTFGLTIDMVILVPLSFYFLVLRRNGYSIVRLAPILVISMLVASMVLPVGHRSTLHFLEAVAVPMEIGLFAWIAWRATRAVHKARCAGGLDPLEQFRSAAFELMQSRRAAGVFATEISIFFYSLGSWRSNTHQIAGTRAYTHYRRSGQAGVVLGFVVLMAVEGFAVHLLLSMWSVLVAWIFTLSSVYGALWLIGDFRATVLRPVLVGDESILIRGGIRYTAEVSRSEISGISREKPEFGKEVLSLKLIGPPTHWIIFSESVNVQGPYGTSRNVRAIGIEPDDPQSFEQALVFSTA